MLHFVYRCYGGENMKGRPPYYSKLLALASFVRAVEKVGPSRGEVIFLNDGPVPAEWMALMESCGEVVTGHNLRIHGSMRKALDLPLSRGWAPDDVVWLAEDDYLYLPDSLANLGHAVERVPNADYFGLYGLIGGRQPNGLFPEDDRIPPAWQEFEAAEVDGHVWRRALSTTSTFGIRLRALAGDRAMMDRAIRTGGAWDHTTSLAFQGFTPYPLAYLAKDVGRSRNPREFVRRTGISAIRMGFNLYAWLRARTGKTSRLLVSADPALITHMETVHLALGTDWTSAAEDTRRWMAERAR